MSSNPVRFWRGRGFPSPARLAAALNPFRFSSEVYDPALGLVQYNYRFYHPVLGRFINRDPIGEDGGLNLYGFVGNNPVDKTDGLGLSWLETFAWFGEWLTGTGESFKALGSNSNAAKNMKNAPGVNAARNAFRAKNKNVKCCKDLADYANYRARFGLSGLIRAGFNSPRQFIGSYRVDVLVWGCNKKKR